MRAGEVATRPGVNIETLRYYERRRAMPLRVTRHGERVLDGKADRVELLEIDHWVGGTHLTPEQVWRWDPSGRLLIEP
jgi:DNA-binding transcriptional MerR regulator